MKTDNTVEMSGKLDDIVRRAADVERLPTLSSKLPDISTLL